MLTWAVWVTLSLTRAAAPLMTPPPAPEALPPSWLPGVPRAFVALIVKLVASMSLLPPAAAPAATDPPTFTMAEVSRVLLLVLPEPPTTLASVASLWAL